MKAKSVPMLISTKPALTALFNQPFVMMRSSGVKMKLHVK